MGKDGRRGLLELLETLDFASSRGEGRRLVQQKAVQIDGEPVRDSGLYLAPGTYLIRVGKRRIARVTLT